MTKGELLQKQFLRYANTQDMLSKLQSREILLGYGNSELNCIDSIGRMKRPNVSAIAERMNMTRSAVSKIVRKLMGKGAVVSYQMPDNQKEIYYRLTSYGREIYKQHHIRHAAWAARDQAFFNAVDDATLSAALRFMNMYNVHLELKLTDTMAAAAPSDDCPGADGGGELREEELQS